MTPWLRKPARAFFVSQIVPFLSTVPVFSCIPMAPLFPPPLQKALLNPMAWVEWARFCNSICFSSIHINLHHLTFTRVGLCERVGCTGTRHENRSWWREGLVGWEIFHSFSSQPRDLHTLSLVCRCAPGDLNTSSTHGCCWDEVTQKEEQV